GTKALKIYFSDLIIEQIAWNDMRERRRASMGLSSPEHDRREYIEAVEDGVVVEDVYDDNVDYEGKGIVIVRDDGIGYCEGEGVVVVCDNGVGCEGEGVVVVHDDGVGCLERVNFKDIVIRDDLIDDFGLVLCSSSSTSLEITR
ncbi:12548_t:CDS:2, partial [Funneliformis caledonium]